MADSDDACIVTWSHFMTESQMNVCESILLMFRSSGSLFSPSSSSLVSMPAQLPRPWPPPVRLAFPPLPLYSTLGIRGGTLGLCARACSALFWWTALLSSTLKPRRRLTVFGNAIPLTRADVPCRLFFLVVSTQSSLAVHVLRRFGQFHVLRPQSRLLACACASLQVALLHEICGRIAKDREAVQGRPQPGTEIPTSHELLHIHCSALLSCCSAPYCKSPDVATLCRPFLGVSGITKISLASCLCSRPSFKSVLPCSVPRVRFSIGLDR